MIDEADLIRLQDLTSVVCDGPGGFYITAFRNAAPSGAKLIRLDSVELLRRTPGWFLRRCLEVRPSAVEPGVAISEEDGFTAFQVDDPYLPAGPIHLGGIKTISTQKLCGLVQSGGIFLANWPFARSIIRKDGIAALLRSFKEVVFSFPADESLTETANEEISVLTEAGFTQFVTPVCRLFSSQAERSTVASMIGMQDVDSSYAWTHSLEDESLFSGFHPAESNSEQTSFWRWSSSVKSTRVIIPVPAAGKIEVRVPVVNRGPSNGPVSGTLLTGSEVDVGWDGLELTMRSSPASRLVSPYIEASIVVENTWRPPGDSRELGICIGPIRVSLAPMP